jgi:symplekin
MQVLQTLTGAAVPSKELTSSIKNLHSKTKVVARFKKAQISY